MPFRPFVVRLAGVDLSPNMAELARSKGIYDRLAVCDIMTFLAGEAFRHASRSHPLQPMWFAYFADIVPVVAAERASLAPGGLLAFTVETPCRRRYYPR